MLYQNGGWWVDMDVICIKHFDLDSSFVFATERHGEKTFSAICIIKGEKSSLFLDEPIKKSKMLPWKVFLSSLSFFVKLIGLMQRNLLIQTMSFLWIKISMLYTLGMRLGIQKNRKILFLMIPSVCLKN